ncbi:replicative DNA helicase [Clostridium sp. USBA 49]|uniref:replicative DNA helicase n=1 Tax=Clostridium sp. USBA 49 TaxID=1881060 RepID=UPI000998F50F|nr:replicative DNA helicase [Clostridium sp. USBA 49]SKA89543.1 replicative DNA helicase [Clostridium sp. USBA 49]
MERYNLDAEMSILGAILSKNDVMCDVICQLEAKDFYNSRHQIIFQAMKEMYENSIHIDVTTLANKLGKNLVQVGGLTYISELITAGFSFAGVKQYVEIVKEKSKLREFYIRLIQAVKKLEDDQDLDEVIEFVQQNSIEHIAKNEEDGNITKVIDSFLDDLEKRYQNGGGIQGIKTHFEKLDFLLGGLHSQELIVVAARPSMGKSVFATNLATNIALKSKKKVAIFSLEMNNLSLIKRIVSNLTSIDSYSLRDGKLTDKQWADVAKVAGILSTDNLKLYEKTMTLNSIIAQCKKLKIQNGLDVVIIDYLQLIEGNLKENRVQEVSEISRKLKLLAKELDITVIALSQLSRAPEQRADHRPQLSDLRESGSIEQDADVVMFLYRDEYYNRDSEDKGIIEIIVAKQRDGQVAATKCAWLPQYQRIANLAVMVPDGVYDKKIFEGR